MSRNKKPKQQESPEAAGAPGEAASSRGLAQNKPGFLDRSTLLTLAGAALVAFAISRLGMVQFGGFDHSVLVDVAWRQVHGQKPHVDFPCTLPVAFFVGAKYAFQLFGVSWRALISFTALFGALTFTWSAWLLRRIFREPLLSLLWAGTLQAMTMVLVSYWWYNPITSASAVVFLFSAALIWREPGGTGARISYGGAVFLLALMKPNIAGILLPWVTVVLLVSRRHRWPMLAASGAAFGLFMIFLWVNHVGLVNLIKGYLLVAQRGGSLKQFLQDLEPGEKVLSCLAFGLAILPGLVGLLRVQKQLRQTGWPWLGLGAMLAGTYGFLTNGEMKLVDLPLVLFGSLLLAATPRPVELERSVDIPPSLPVFWNRFAMGLCLVLVVAGLRQGITRQRVKVIGPYMFYEDQLASEAFPEGFFKGLRSGEIFVAVNKELAHLIQQQPNASIAFGPRLQWAYAAFNKPSPINQPIWWHPGVSFAASDEQLYISRFMESRFDLIVIGRGNGPTVYMSEEFIRELLQHYTPDQSYSTLIVLRRNNA